MQQAAEKSPELALGLIPSICLSFPLGFWDMGHIFICHFRVIQDTGEQWGDIKVSLPKEVLFNLFVVVGTIGLAVRCKS
jgi:hypothetical protein